MSYWCFLAGGVRNDDKQKNQQMQLDLFTELCKRVSFPYINLEDLQRSSVVEWSFYGVEFSVISEIICFGLSSILMWGKVGCSKRDMF